jgi:hypothetical protein
MRTSPRRHTITTRPSRTKKARRLGAALAAATCLAIVAAPVAALATTGSQTDKRSIVTITDTGAHWNPTLSKLHVTTGVTVRLDILNNASQSHWFQLGNRRTTTLRKGQSYSFFYVFDKPGVVSWQVGLGNVSGAGFHGTYTVHFPSHFD